MIKRMLKPLMVSWGYFCIATVITQLILLAVLFAKGALTPDKRLRLWAYWHGIDANQLWQDELDSRVEPPADSMQALNKLPLMRVRNDAISEGHRQVKTLENQLLGERERYEVLRGIFDNRLADLADVKAKASKEIIKQTLEVIDPIQAKDILVQILREGALDDVVEIMVKMPANRQKKIFAEFQTPLEVQYMNDVLMRLREADEETTGLGGEEETP